MLMVWGTNFKWAATQIRHMRSLLEMHFFEGTGRIFGARGIQPFAVCHITVFCTANSSLYDVTICKQEIKWLVNLYRRSNIVENVEQIEIGTYLDRCWQWTRVHKTRSQETWQQLHGTQPSSCRLWWFGRDGGGKRELHLNFCLDGVYIEACPVGIIN